MKKYFLAPLFLCTSLQAGFSIDIGPSYRIDWQNVSSTYDESTILEPLKDYDQYSHVGIWELAGEVQTDHCNLFYLGGKAKYGWVGTGSANMRSAYLLDDEQTFALNNAYLTGHTGDIQVYAGLRIYSLKNRLAVIPCGGYEYHQKRFTTKDGFNEFNGDVEVVTTTDNFVHRDHMRGPFVGIDFEWIAKKSIQVFGGFHWNFYKYSSLGEISYLIDPSDTVSIAYDLTRSDNAHIGGPSAFLGLNYYFNRCAYLCLQSSYYYTYLWNGNRYNSVFLETYTSSVLTAQRVEETRLELKDFDWSSWSIQLMLGYDF